jgi:hypothetical protein
MGGRLFFHSFGETKEGVDSGSRYPGSRPGLPVYAGRVIDNVAMKPAAMESELPGRI